MSTLMGLGVWLATSVMLGSLLLCALLLQLHVEGQAARLRPWVVWALGGMGALAMVMVLAGAVIGALR